MNNFILSPKTNPPTPSQAMSTTSPAGEETPQEFLTPSTSKVQELPSTERKKALRFALNLSSKFKRHSDSEWKRHDREEDPVCRGLGEEVPEPRRWSQSPRASGSFDDSEADPFYWVSPKSPIRFHQPMPEDPHLRYQRQRSASTGTSGSGGKSGLTPMSTLATPDALRRLPAVPTPSQPEVRPRSSRPTLQNVASTPSMPMAASHTLVRPRSRRPILKGTASTTAIPDRTPEIGESLYQRRPTLRDMLLGSQPSPAPDVALPPDPLSLKRAATFDSSTLSLDNVNRPPSHEYQFITQPQGNAFAQAGFWDSIGAKEPKSVERKRDDLLYPTPPKRRESTDDDVFASPEVDQPLASATFSTPDFLKAMGRKLTKVPTNKTHPFNGISPPTDYASRDAYYQVLEALVACWFSTAIARDDTPDSEPSSSTIQRTESLERLGTAISTASKSSPLRRLASRTALVMQARPAINISSSSVELSVLPPSGLAPSSLQPSVLPPSVLPSSPKSKKKRKTKLYEMPVFNKATSRAYDITKLILREMQEQFGTVMYPDLGSFIKAKPQELSARVELYDVEEHRFVKEYATKASAGSTPSKPGSRSRAGSKETEHPKRDSKEGRKSKEAQDATEGGSAKELSVFSEEFRRLQTEKTLEAQRTGLQMLHTRQKSDALRILDPSLRILWATRWMEWAKSVYEREVERFDEQLATAMELKDLYEGMGLEESKSSSSSEDEGGRGSSSDDEFKYVSFLQDIQRQRKDAEMRTSNKNQARDMDSPTPGPKLARTESEIEARRRRRTTQLHGNSLRSPIGPASPIGGQGKSEDVDGWMEMLNSSLDREIQRQKHDAAQRGMEISERKSLRVDPTFTFDKDGGGPKKRHLEHSGQDSSVFDSGSHEDEEFEFKDKDSEDDELEEETSVEPPYHAT